MSLAKETFELNEHDNTTLDAKNLDSVAIQKNQDWEKESTAWIFKDGSALIFTAPNIWVINDEYGLHPDYEQLD